MIRLILLHAAALGLALAPAAALAQTDDRILNDVFTVLRGETLLARTRQLCLDFADTDLEADFADWTTRNLEVLRLADVLVRTRERLEPGMLGEMRNAAAGEAETSFARESDRAAFCEGIGQAMEAGQVDLTNWFPTETRRMAEAEQGQWPLLELEGVQPIADAMEVKQVAFMMADVFVRCGVLFGAAADYEEAGVEWQARNGYSIELADRVLKNWGALHPRRWEEARDAAGAEVDALFADSAAAEQFCTTTAEGTFTGEKDLDRVRPELHESVLANAEIVP